MIVEVPAAADAATVTVIVELPEPGAAIEVGLKATLTPEGCPDAESATAALKPPETVVLAVAPAEPPCAIESDAGETENAKSGLLDGLKTTSMTGWSSMPFGATPVWPCRKSNMPTPVIWTGTLAVWKLLVAVNFASNSARAFETPAARGLPEPTQAGSGISAIIVLPDASDRMRW